MASVSRSAQFAKLHKVLKKCYKPFSHDDNRPVLEHLLFACCLEDAHFEAAEEAFAALVQTFFDWNEVRVTSIAELSEVMASLPDARAAANRLKRVLHAVFENTYAFDLEDRRKKNLGPTVKWLEKLDGATPFSVSYVVQAALGGHAIPIDGGTMRLLRLLDLVSEKDAAASVVPGMERAIAKSKGVEFGSLLHQLGADFTANPYSPALREILLQIDPDIQGRLPKRRSDKPAKKPFAEQTDQQEAKSSAHAKPSASESGKKTAGEQKEAAAGAAAAGAEKHPAAAKKRSSTAKQPPAAPSDAAVAGETPRAPEPARRKSVSAGLAKRKPR